MIQQAFSASMEDLKNAFSNLFNKELWLRSLINILAVGFVVIIVFNVISSLIGGKTGSMIKKGMNLGT